MTLRRWKGFLGPVSALSLSLGADEDEKFLGFELSDVWRSVRLYSRSGFIVNILSARNKRLRSLRVIC